MKDLWKRWWWLIVLVAVKLAVQLVAANQYGFHRDEFLYLAQAEHLAWGYMEVPPMIAFLGALIRAFGDGIYWIKLFPALFGGASMVILALMVRDLGGRRPAQVLALIAFLVVPAYLRTHHLFQPVFLNQFMWLVLTFLVLRLVRSGESKYWYWIGVCIGVGMLTKYSMAFPTLGLIAGVLLTDQRKWLTRKEPYVAALIALIIFAPNLWWQFDHNFPVVNHMRVLRETQLVNVSPLGFLTDQLLMLYAGSLLWVPGLFYLFRRKMKTFRILGWMFVLVLGVLLLTSGKSYYTLGIYPVLISAGAVWWEQLYLDRSWLQSALPAFLVFISLGVIPYGVPVLPVESMKKYGMWMAEHAGLTSMLVWEDGIQRELPQDYADMYGWEEMVQNVSRFYHSLPEQERQKCNIWGGSYGHAGAMLLFGEKYDLPKDITSFNGSFLLWAKPEADFDRQIHVDDRLSLESRYFDQVVLVDSTRSPYARDPGYIVYRTKPLVDIPTTYRQLVSENQSTWSRK